MKRRFGRVRAVLTVLVAWGVLAGGGMAGGAPATAADSTLHRSPARSVAPGVAYGEFRMTVPRGIVHGHLLTVDLADPRVSVDLLYPGAVGARSPVSQLAADRGAVGAVNGDFFNITETQHPGVEATGASVGPAVASGRQLKGAVPDGQRFGPVMPPGATTEDVIGIGYDRRARLDRLTLRGAVADRRGGAAAARAEPVRPAGRRYRRLHAAVGPGVPGARHLRHGRRPGGAVHDGHRGGDRPARPGDGAGRRAGRRRGGRGERGAGGPGGRGAATAQAAYR